MSRQSIGDLALRQAPAGRGGGAAMVPAGGPETGAQSALGIRGFVARSRIPWGVMVLGGAALIATGVLVGWALPAIFTFNAVSKILVSAGAGSMFLGGLKKFTPPPTPPDPQLALPPVDPAVMGERSRRLRSILALGDNGSAPTFEYLVRTTRWTQEAVLTTLLEMKNRGEVIEDLDLDTGQWVYRLGDEGGPSTSGRLMLAEHTQRLVQSEDSV